MNMAGGQPVSIENLARCRELTREHGVRSSSTRRGSRERLLHQGARARLGALGRARDPPGDEPVATAPIFSSKKDHFVTIGGFLAHERRRACRAARELVVVYEGFPHYGGIAGRDMEAIAQGIHETVDEAIHAHVHRPGRYLGGLLDERGVPDRRPRRRARRLPRREARSSPTSRRSSSPPRRSPPRSTSTAACARWSAASSPASTATSRTKARARPPHHPAPRLHAGAPDYVAEMIARVLARADEVPGLRMTTSRRTCASSRRGSRRRRHSRTSARSECCCKELVVPRSSLCKATRTSSSIPPPLSTLRRRAGYATSRPASPTFSKAETARSRCSARAPRTSAPEPEPFPRARPDSRSRSRRRPRRAAAG